MRTLTSTELQNIDRCLSILESSIASTEACESAALAIAALSDQQLRTLPDSLSTRLLRQAGRITIFAGVECG